MVSSLFFATADLGLGQRAGNGINTQRPDDIFQMGHYIFAGGRVDAHNQNMTTAARVIA